MSAAPQAEPLMTVPEVAALFRVHPKTVSRWASTGTVPSVRTPGGRYRFRESDVTALYEAGQGGAR